MTRLSLAPMVAAVLLVVAYLVPNHYPPWSSFYNEFAAALSLWILVAYALWSRNWRDLSVPWIALVALFLAGVPLLQWMLGHVDFLVDAVVPALYLTGFAGAISVAASFQGEQRVRLSRGLALALIAAALLSAGVALYQWLGLSGLYALAADLWPGGRPFGNLGQPNQLGTLLCLAAAGGMYLRGSAHLRPASAALLLLFLALAIALTQSRTGLLITVFIAVWWCGREWLEEGRRPSWLPLLLPLGVITFTQLLQLAESFLADGLGATITARDLAGELRPILWQQLLVALGQQPLQGYGWGQVSAAQLAVAAESVPSMWTEYSHNLALDLLLWNGVPLGGLALLALMAWGIAAVQDCRSLEARYALAGIGAILIHALLEHPLAYAYFLLPLGLLMGIVESGEARPGRARGLHLPGWLALTTLLSVGLLLGLIWREYRVIEEDHRLMRFESAGVGTLRAARPAPEVWLLDAPREALRLARIEAAPGMSAAELTRMARSVRRYPHAPALARHALAQALNGRPEEAALALRQLRQLHGELLYESTRERFAAWAREYPQLDMARLFPGTDAAISP